MQLAAAEANHVKAEFLNELTHPHIRGMLAFRCCQSNANRSPKSAGSRLSGRKLTPFGQSSRSVLLEDIATV